MTFFITIMLITFVLIGLVLLVFKIEVRQLSDEKPEIPAFLEKQRDDATFEESANFDPVKE